MLCLKDGEMQMLSGRGCLPIMLSVGQRLWAVYYGGGLW
jgi:hypothetical protein